MIKKGGKFVTIEITPAMLEHAKKKASEMGKLKNSITSGTGNLAGFLGEEIVKEYLHIPTDDNTYQYDIVHNGLRLEVKTKQTTVEPKAYYDCSIAAFNTKQDCDYYIFTRILNDYSKGWILGCSLKSQYLLNSRFLKKGEKDGNNNFEVKADCYNLPISQLDDIKTIK
jgi:hypothetical protein